MTPVSRQLRALAQVGRALFCLTGAYQLLGSVPLALSQEKPAAQAKQAPAQQAPAKTVADTGKKATADTGKKATSDSAQLSAHPTSWMRWWRRSRSIPMSCWPRPSWRPPIRSRSSSSSSGSPRTRTQGQGAGRFGGQAALGPEHPVDGRHSRLVKRLADDIQWTTELGNAFLAQQADVMTAVQRMRKKAKDKGALETNEQQKVETKVVEKKEVIVIESAESRSHLRSVLQPDRRLRRLRSIPIRRSTTRTIRPARRSFRSASA